MKIKNILILIMETDKIIFYEDIKDVVEKSLQNYNEIKISSNLINF